VTEHFGWPAHYEQPEEYWADQERRHQAAVKAELEHDERRRQDYCRLAVLERLAKLRISGGLRDDRLSHSRICELEWETGIRSGPWSDYLNELREAQLKDTQGDT
jgi:hypothetical protein